MTLDVNKHIGTTLHIMENVVKWLRIAWIVWRSRCTGRNTELGLRAPRGRLNATLPGVQSVPMALGSGRLGA